MDIPPWRSRHASARRVSSTMFSSMSAACRSRLELERSIMSDDRFSLSDFARMKDRGGKIAMVTAYDAPSARLADAAGVDSVLVGDSAAMTVLGHDSTVPVTIEEMLMLTRAVSRGARRPLVVADMPFGSFQASNRTAVTNAIRFVKDGGAHAVKIEGAGASLKRV